MEKHEEDVIFAVHPAMFKNHPIAFTISMLMIPLGLVLLFRVEWQLALIPLVVGLIILLVWWIDTLSIRLEITNKRTILRKGILSRYSNEVFHANVRNIEISQSFLQRIFGVGKIGIASAGQVTQDIEVSGIPDPEHVRNLINKYRYYTQNDNEADDEGDD